MMFCHILKCLIVYTSKAETIFGLMNEWIDRKFICNYFDEDNILIVCSKNVKLLKIPWDPWVLGPTKEGFVCA